MDLDRLDVSISADGDGGVGALGEDDGPGALGVLLGALCDGLGDLGDVLGLDAVRLGECGGLGLVADEDVDVGQDLVERVLEELGDEWRGKVEDEGLQGQLRYI